MSSLNDNFLSAVTVLVETPQWATSKRRFSFDHEGKDDNRFFTTKVTGKKTKNGQAEKNSLPDRWHYHQNFKAINQKFIQGLFTNIQLQNNNYLLKLLLSIITIFFLTP